MDANNELLLFIYENSDMGVSSTKKLLNLLKTKDNKIKSDLEDTLKKYEYFLKESKCLLKEKKIKLKKKILVSLTANVAMCKEVDADNSDTKIADILIRGLNMGEVNITKKTEAIKANKDREITKLADELQKFSQEAIQLYKKYL